jgi:ribose 5-phosphate isomerase A
LKTDQDFFIIDAPFPPLLTVSDLKAPTTTTNNPTEEPSSTSPPTTHGKHPNGWEVTTLANAIKTIEGVLEVGIFSGRTGPEAIESGTLGGQRPVACYFGMADGSVTVRKASPKVDA